MSEPFDQIAWDALVSRHGERASAAADDVVNMLSDLARGDEFCALGSVVHEEVWQRIRIRVLEALRDAEKP